MTSEYDIIIKNANIVDGSGKPKYEGSIGISGERIAAVGEVKGDAAKIIDASGLIATPGFIDAHSHADLTLLWYPKCESYVMQGVTTFVGGNCGRSVAPIKDIVRINKRTTLDEYVHEYEPYKYYPKSLYPIDTINEWMKEKFGWTIDYRTMGGFFESVEKKGISINYAPLFAHGTARSAVLGLDFKRPSTANEVDETIELIHQGMEEGCIGMSSGVDYDPASYSDHEELTKCVAALKKYEDVVWSPHWRRTGRRLDIGKGGRFPDRIDGIMECVEICRKTGVRLNIAHLQSGWRIQPPPPPSLQKANSEATLEPIDEAIADGLDISWDVVSPSSAYLRTFPYLCSLLAPWIRELGSREELARWLKIQDFRKDVRDAIFSGRWNMTKISYNPRANPHWGRNITLLESSNSDYEGKTIAEIAAKQGKDPLEALFDIIVEDPYTMAGGTLDTDRRGDHIQIALWKHPRAMVCSDSRLMDNKYEQKAPPYHISDIRSFSAYPLFIIDHVRDRKIFTIEEAVRKMASLPAEVFNLKDRGMIREGAFADIVLLDLPKIDAKGVGADPRHYAEGFEHVFVNGTEVVSKGKHTGSTTGKVLKRE